MTRLFFLLWMALLAYPQQDDFKKHTVKWYEDLRTISAKYGVPVDVLKAINKIEGDGVAVRQVLLIPTNESQWETVVAEEITPEEENRQEEVAAVVEEIESPEVSLGLLLPFGSGSQAQRDNVMDFYSGVLLAARELGEQGIDINLDVIDFAGAENIGSKTVIGPFRSADFEQALDRCPENSFVVSPLDQKTAVLAKDNAQVVQAAASGADQYGNSIGEVKGDNYIIITSRQDKAVFEETADALKQEGLKYSVCYCDVQGEIENWESAYREEGLNVVILAINSEAALNNAVRNMGIEESRGNILCFAGSKVASYESIPTENLHRAHIHALCSYYIDYSDPDVLDFIHKYRALYNTEPGQFAFQGHDIAYFLIKTRHELGAEWKDKVTELPQMDLLQSSFKLKRLPNGGLVNVAGRKVEYQRDFSVRLIKN